MRRWIASLLLCMVSAITLFAQEDAPLPEAGEGLEIEPPLLIKSRDRDGMPVVPAPPQSVDVAKAEKDLARAKKNAASAENLFRAGIIAKVEAEERVLKVVRLEAVLAMARLEEAKIKTDEETAEPNENNNDLAALEQAAQRAAEAKRRAELDAALRNLQRQQKLLALGSGHKADVNRAEKKLADLQRGEN